MNDRSTDERVFRIVAGPARERRKVRAPAMSGSRAHIVRHGFLLAAMTVITHAVHAQSAAIEFVDVASSVSLGFRHVSPLTPERHLHLFMGSGVAWLDYDLDQWPDLFFSQGTPFTESTGDRGPQPTDGIFRNRLGSFQDVIRLSGISKTDYSMGTAVGDFNSDGFPDLYVTAYGPNSLFRNNGDGTWSEVQSQPCLRDERFGSACTWFDPDGDGDLDLYVVNYLKLDRHDYPLCSHTEGGVRYPGGCHPRHQQAESDLLLKNNGDGTFSDISRSAGICDDHGSPGLGIAVFDADSDGDVDLYVANDTTNNQLWLNDGTGQFSDDAVLTGLAVNGIGVPEAGMGVAVRDVDGDLQADVFVTNYFNESNTLYRNDGAFFTDVTAEFGLDAPSRQRLAFGTSLFDADNDSWPDLFIANGHVQSYPPELDRYVPFAQLPQLFRNESGRRFQDVSQESGRYFRKPIVGRSSAIADFDRDGRLDIAVQHLNDQAALLHNRSDSHNWISMNLTGVHSNRCAIGATIEIENGPRQMMAFCGGSTGYLACDARTVHFGLANCSDAVDVRVQWPDGTTDHYRARKPATNHQLIQGRGDD
ncbi:MAG: CRTAC1 family protein [Planctomycetaceae bacterium]|nr:CRTAC1 family protein [Planctomycetaceae bacterium]